MSMHLYTVRIFYTEIYWGEQNRVGSVFFRFPILFWMFFFLHYHFAFIDVYIYGSFLKKKKRGMEWCLFLSDLWHSIWTSPVNIWKLEKVRTFFFFLMGDLDWILQVQSLTKTKLCYSVKKLWTLEKAENHEDILQAIIWLHDKRVMWEWFNSGARHISSVMGNGSWTYIYSHFKIRNQKLKFLMRNLYFPFSHLPV